MKLDRLLLILIAALAIALLTATAHSRSLATVHAALLGLAPAWEDRDVEPAVKAAQMATIARAVERADKSRTVRAFLLAWGWHESAYALEVHRGNCRKPRCDWHPRHGFLARSPWQLHRNGLSAEQWSRMIGVENTQHQADEAARRVRSALAMCRGDVRGAFVALGTGRGCRGTIKGLEERVAMVRRIEARL